ncbi:unnamed protein product, partial [Nesidiocoris tenuis]
MLALCSRWGPDPVSINYRVPVIGNGHLWAVRSQLCLIMRTFLQICPARKPFLDCGG